MPITGRCNCSSITVTLEELPPHCAVCYCANCKRSGGGPISIVYILDKPEVNVNDPKNFLKTYHDTDTKTGNAVDRSFCSNCGSPIYSTLGPESPKIIIKGGLFDSIPAPSVEFFEHVKPQWLDVNKTGAQL